MERRRPALACIQGTLSDQLKKRPSTMNAGDLAGLQKGKLIVEFTKAGESKRTINVPLQGNVTTN